MSNLLLKDNNATKQLIFKSFHCDGEVDNAAQSTDLTTAHKILPLNCTLVLLFLVTTSIA